ncbi:MAG: SDR family oxidoreductase [Bacteroidota bacterium]
MQEAVSTFQSKNYWAVILGSSSGMGQAAARKLARQGMNLCLLHRDRRQALPAIEAELEALRAYGVQVLAYNKDALKADKRSEVLQDLQTALGTEGRVRLLLHAISKGNLKLMNPPSPHRAPFETHTDSATHTQLYQSLEQLGQEALPTQAPLLGPTDLQLTIEAMALSLYDWTRALFDAQLFAADARILGLSSEGSQRAWRSYAAVSAAKAALEAICRSIALEFAPYGLRCNIVQPGVTDTPSLRMIPGSEQLKLRSLLRNPFQRLTTPKDVADVIYLLCRDEAAWINGALIPVDGGERNS